MQSRFTKDRASESNIFEEKAEIAQLVEHDLAKVGVASSSLVFRSRSSLKRAASFAEKGTLAGAFSFVMPEKAINLTFDLTDADGIVLLRRGYSVIDRSFLFDIHYQQGNMGTVHMDFT